MKKSVLKARISVLEAEVARLERSRDIRREMSARAERALTAIESTLDRMRADVFAQDRRSTQLYAVGPIATPSLEMLTCVSRDAIQQNRQDLDTLDREGL